MTLIPDDPRNTEHYSSRVPICPVCGAECEIVYKDGHEIIGCNECITEEDAYEEEECFLNE